MLMPKRVKYRKPFSAPRIKGNAKRGAEVVFGEYGLKALEPKWITARQIESARITLSRFIKKKVNSGFAFSRIKPSPNTRLKPVWVKVKGLRTIGYVS